MELEVRCKICQIIFTDALNNRYSITTEKTDERLSTREAKERLQNIDIGTRDSTNKHSISAQIILEDWFRSLV